MFLEKGLPTIERDCHMEGMCKKDFDAIEGMVKRFETLVDQKQMNWKATDEALGYLMKSFKAAGADCRHHKKHHKKYLHNFVLLLNQFSVQHLGDLSGFMQPVSDLSCLH